MEASIEKLHQVFKTMVYGENTEDTSQAKVSEFNQTPKIEYCVN